MKLSVIIPAYNEADNIGDTIDEIQTVVASMGSSIVLSDIVVVDDNSTDETYDRIKDRGDESVRAIRLSRRSGSHVALRAGLDAVTGDVAICISADGQDDPGILSEMISSWEAGCDIVWALRKKRDNEPLLNRLFATLFYRALVWFGGTALTEIDLSRADFYLIDRKVVNAIKACRERNTSLFGLIIWLGFSQGYVEYERRSRKSGESKWNFKSRVQLAKDWIIAFSGVPLKLMTYVGFFIAGTGFLYALFVVTRSILYDSPLLGWPSIMTAILILGGGQIMMLGVMGEYLWRTLDESRDRPTYFVENDTNKDMSVPLFSRRRRDLR